MDIDLIQKHLIRTSFFVLIIAFIGFGMAVGCKSESDGSNDSVVISKTVVNSWTTIQTIKHDGHEYVVATTSTGASMIHKPNCKFDSDE